MQNKALFLDRDGILIEDTSYPHKAEDLCIRLSILPLLTAAIERGFLLIIVTNQSGIARGYFTERQYLTFNNWMLDAFKEHNIEFSAIYFCPYLKGASIKEYDKDSILRKPRPGMFLEAQKDFDIDFYQSIMVGDKASDVIQVEGLKSYLIQGNYPLPQNENVFQNEKQLMKELGWI